MWVMSKQQKTTTKKIKKATSKRKSSKPRTMTKVRSISVPIPLSQKADDYLNSDDCPYTGFSGLTNAALEKILKPIKESK